MRAWKRLWRGAIPAVALALAVRLGGIAFALAMTALLSASPSLAISQGGFIYICSPICTGVRMTYIEPKPVYVGIQDEIGDNAVVWVGIESFGHASTCADGPLIQHGTNPVIYKDDAFPESHTSWHEEYPCDGAVDYGTISAEAGDKIFIQILCTANCTQGSTTSSVTYTWTNVTKGITQNLVRPLDGSIVGGMPSVPAHMFWDKIDIKVEGQAPYPPNFTPLKIIHPEVFQAGAWVPVPWENTNIERTVATTNLGSNWWNVFSPSAQVNDGIYKILYICDDVVFDTRGFTSRQPCPAAAYTATNGFGQ